MLERCFLNCGCQIAGAKKRSFQAIQKCARECVHVCVCLCDNVQGFPQTPAFFIVLSQMLCHLSYWEISQVIKAGWPMEKGFYK